jgi:hypothetical protein
MHQSKPQTPQTTQPHHRVRTFFASLFGILAISLVLSSLVIVWLNRTLTDTNTYVKTVAPLATKPAVQVFIAQKASDELVKNAPIDDLAKALLPAGQDSGKTVDQLKLLLQPIIYNNVLKVVQAPAFVTLWENTNQTAHAAFIKQINSGSPSITLDLNPTVTGVINQLKTTQLAQFSDKIDTKPDSAKIDLAGSGIEKAHKYYQDFQKATWFIVALTTLCLVLAVIISVHHLKTLRRMLFGTGILTLLFAFSIWATSYISVGNSNDLVTKNAIVAIVQTLLHNLQLASVIIGVVCIAGGVGLKIYEKSKAPKPNQLRK